METLGPARSKTNPAGLTRRQADKQLQARLVAVRKKPAAAGVATHVRRVRRPMARAGRDAARLEAANRTRLTTVVGRLKATFGSKRLADLRPHDVAAYIADQTADGFAPATVNRDVSIFHDLLKVAVREELIDSNPASGAEGPRVRQKRWRILKPAEVALVARSFTDEQARVVFLVLVLCGLRRHELQQLRWRDVDLVENVLRAADSKTEDGVRSIALPSVLAEQFWQHRRRTRYQGDDDLVFCHPDRGTVYRAEPFAEQFRAALKTAGITDRMRPFHDLRHTAITNDAASGSSPIAVMTKAGHSDMRTTKRYLHLAGVVFHEEAERLEQRYGLGALSTEPATEPAPASAHERAVVRR